MPKGAKRKKNSQKDRKQTGEVSKRPLPIADESQIYGKCVKSLGDRRFEIECIDRKTRIGRLRGAIRKRKKSWLNVDQWVIAAVRDFQDDKVDIIEILAIDEVQRLEKLGELSTSLDEVHDDIIDFEEDDGKVEINIDDI